MPEARRSSYAEGHIDSAYEYALEAKDYVKEPSIYKKLVQEKRVDGAWDQRTSVIESSDPVEREEGEPMEPIKAIEGYTPVGKVRNWYKEAAVTRETLQDHKKMDNFMKETTSGWAEDFERGKNKFVLKHFNLGANTSGHAIFNNSITGNLSDPSGNYAYDQQSKPIFNLSNNTRTRYGGAGAYSNAIALDLDPENFETLYNLVAVTNAYNEDGTEITNIPNFILYNTALNFTTRRLLESTKIPGQSTNDTNVLESIVEPIPTAYFTDADGYVIGQKNKGFRFIYREMPIIEIWYDHVRKMHYMSKEERYGGYFYNWRFYGASNLPNSA